MDHDMSMTMSMPTTASSGAAPTPTSMAMDHGDSMGGCTISMLWNWNTVDSCFISSSWKITSDGMFAGSCIGVILLVMSLEFMRRAVKEYDRYLIKKHSMASQLEPTALQLSDPTSEADTSRDGTPRSKGPENTTAAACTGPASGYRPAWYEQAIRAFLHMVQFAVAYFVMLLAMYYNGYIIICIFIGAYLGAFIFQYETLGASRSTSAAGEATVCCG